MTRQLVDKFQTSLRRANETRLRVEDLFAQNELLERDLHAVYEGLFLRSVVGFEDLLEQVFFAVLNGRSSRNEWQPKVQGSQEVLRKCVLEQQEYLTWLPIKKAVERAQIYLRSGRPFSIIDDGEKSQLSQVLAIRNAIAHPSKAALNKFRKHVIGNTPIPPRERRPAAFLRGLARPNVRRYEIFVQSLGGIANKMC